MLHKQSTEPLPLPTESLLPPKAKQVAIEEESDEVYLFLIHLEI